MTELKDQNVKGGHGGARAGAGRPPQRSGEQAKARLWAAIEKVKEETGRDPFEELVKLATARKDHRDKVLPAMRILADILKSGETTQDVNVTRHEAPGVLLPEQQPDPADVVRLHKTG